MRWTALVLTTLWLLGTAVAPIKAGDDPVNRYRALQKALDAESRDAARVDNHLAKLTGTPLEGHGEMAVLRKRLDTVDAQRVADFLEHHSGLAGIDAFRVAWLRELADREAWQRLLATYDGERDVYVRCAVVQAREALGRVDAAIELAVRLWRVGYRQPARCNEAFDLLQREGELTSERLRHRMRLAIAAGNPGIVRAYRDRLPPEAQTMVAHWIAVYLAPLRAADLEPEALGNPEARRTVIVSGMRALAQRDAATARTTWQDLRTKYELGATATGKIKRHIALQAVYSDLDRGGHWLRSLAAEHANETVHAWRVRDALREPNWPQVLSATDGMAAPQATRARWRYWRARALRAQGAEHKAESLFRQAAQHFGYYGFLAADALDKAYAAGDDAPPADTERQATVADREGPNRGLLLHRAGDEINAIRSWRHAINGIERARDRVAAARVAARADWPWASMFASGRGGHHGASPLRFPRGYQAIVTEAADTHGIPAPWLYALIRQESAFRNTACSSAGACGLTQLMPNTGAWMLKRLGHASDNLSQRLAQAELNIPAGAAYLANLRGRFDHPVAALAAYNAGPSNVERWLEQGMPAGSARWIETLPFGETREYVIDVLFNRAVYDLLANQSTKRLAALLDAPGS